MCSFLWRADFNVRHFPWLFFTSLTQSLLMKLQFPDSVCLTLKLFLGMPCLQISLLWCPASFHVGSRDLNSGPYACIGNNLPLGPFPQFSSLFWIPRSFVFTSCKQPKAKDCASIFYCSSILIISTAISLFGAYIYISFCLSYCDILQ